MAPRDPRDWDSHVASCLDANTRPASGATSGPALKNKRQSVLALSASTAEPRLSYYLSSDDEFCTQSLMGKAKHKKKPPSRERDLTSEAALPKRKQKRETKKLVQSNSTSIALGKELHAHLETRYLSCFGEPQNIPPCAMSEDHIDESFHDQKTDDETDDMWHLASNEILERVDTKTTQRILKWFEDEFGL
ncbi:hypothetical protein HDU82_008673 [Entophlyctis luteolus]|nr:hypothetical protein HDU82_008673 [Entophlyctis luteolus]